MDTNKVIKVSFLCIQLQTNAEALCDLPCIGTQHMEPNNFLLWLKMSVKYHSHICWYATAVDMQKIKHKINKKQSYTDNTFFFN